MSPSSDPNAPEPDPSDGPSEGPGAQGPTGDGETCREARRQIAAFLHESPGERESRFLRAHIERCADCAQAYREAVEGAARVGHALRTDREERTRTRRHAELVRLSRGSGGSRYRGRPWLKLFLASCGLIFLLTRLPALGFGAALTVERTSGVVVAADVRVDGDQKIALVRGQRCATGPTSSAVLRGADAELRLGSDTRVLVEEAGGPGGARVRLLAGALDLDGECVVTTEYGVLTLDGGRASVRLDGGLRAECTEGGLELVGPLGTHRIEPGESVDVGL